MIDSTITSGNILTALALGGSGLGLFLSWRRENKLRRKEYADRVRASASLVIAKVDRWKQLSLDLFERIQVSITDADRLMMESKDTVQVRDTFWSDVVSKKSELSNRRMDEEIEIAYADLYGYDSWIHLLFSRSIECLKTIDSLMVQAFQSQAQHAILSSQAAPELLRSGFLGNQLRAVVVDCAKLAEAEMDLVLDGLRSELLKIINSGDDAIVQKSVQICSPEEVCPDDPGSQFRVKILSFDSQEAAPDFTLCVEQSVLPDGPFLSPRACVPFGHRLLGQPPDDPT